MTESSSERVPAVRARTTCVWGWESAVEMDGARCLQLSAELLSIPEEKLTPRLVST